jgi:N-acetylmuramoyl-L-alanine amidase
MIKATGLLLILIAMIAAVLVAMPSRNGKATPTVTADPALVIAAGGTAPAPANSTPAADDGIALEARYQRMVICLDPGHGGQDRGHQHEASALAPAMDESYFNLATANALRDRLEQHGFEVVMTRTEDLESNAGGLDANLDGNTRASGTTEDESFQFGEMDEAQTRIDRCNDARADMMVSIHFDGSSDPADQGSILWYDGGRTFGPQNQLLASLLLEELGLELTAAGYVNSGQLKEASQADPYDEQIRKELLLLGPEQEGLKEPSAMPGAMVEVLTITNDNDAMFLASDGGLEAIATALDRAIVRYIDMNPAD